MFLKGHVLNGIWLLATGTNFVISCPIVIWEQEFTHRVLKYINWKKENPWDLMDNTLDRRQKFSVVTCLMVIWLCLKIFKNPCIYDGISVDFEPHSEH